MWVICGLSVGTAYTELPPAGSTTTRIFTEDFNLLNEMPATRRARNTVGTHCCPCELEGQDTVIA